MVARTLIALDNEALIIDPSSPNGTAGDPIINNSDTPDGTIFEYQPGFPPQTVTLDDVAPSDPDVFDDDQSTLHTITDGQGLVANGTSVESESRIDLQALDSDGDPTGPIISIFVFSQNGNFNDVWGVGLTEALVPGTLYVKVDGSNDGDSDYTTFVPCFAAGTRIRTPTGVCVVESLTEGQLVWTPDGPRQIEWCGRVKVDGTGPLAPVEIAPGVFGNSRKLRVSPQHRVAIHTWQSELLFGSREVLVAAVHLLDLPGVRRAPAEQVEYIHFMCDRHVLVEAEGVLSESFYPGDIALAALAPDTRAELLGLFPMLSDETQRPRMAGSALRGHEARVLASALA
ncbi:MAG: Hint domain-containing protein [Pseudomonadota bacterium]